MKTVLVSLALIGSLLLVACQKEEPKAPVAARDAAPDVIGLDVTQTEDPE